MTKKITPFPFSLWVDLEPKTKRLFIGGVFLIIIVSMVTGYFPELIELITPAKK